MVSVSVSRPIQLCLPHVTFVAQMLRWHCLGKLRRVFWPAGVWAPRGKMGTLRRSEGLGSSTSWLPLLSQVYISPQQCLCLGQLACLLPCPAPCPITLRPTWPSPSGSNPDLGGRATQRLLWCPCCALGAHRLQSLCICSRPFRPLFRSCHALELFMPWPSLVNGS